jgi:6-phosphogluconolactonase
MRIFSKIWSVVVLVLVLLAASSFAETLYMTNGGANTVSAYRIAENGALTVVAGSPFPSGKAPASVAVDRIGRFLYVANIGDNTLSAYRIAGNGALVSLASVVAGIEPVSVAVDPFGRFVYVSNLGGNYNLSNSNVSSFRIGKSGGLTGVIGSPFAAGIEPVSVVADPWGRFVYAANSGSEALATETISAYRVGQNGVLSSVPGSPFPNGEGPEAAAMDPWGRFLYVANFYDNVLSGYRIAENGALTPLTGSPFPTGSLSTSVVVDPLGRFVYVASAGTISSYRIAGNGALIPLSGSPYTVGFSPDSLVIDLSGRFLYTTNGNNVSGYRIAGNGALTPLAGSPFKTGFSPSSMAVAQ